MNRKKMFFLNTVTGILKQIAVIICAFILPRYILAYYGSSVNGLVTSITHFLNFITFLEMGVGAVIQSNLYQPLADGDMAQVSKIYVSSQRFFRKIAYIFIGYILVLLVLYPFVINREYPWLFSDSLLVVIAVSLFAQYYFSLTCLLLLNADQKSYVPMLITAGSVIANTILGILLMKLGASIHAVKILSAAVYLCQPLLLILYVRRHYRIDHRIQFTGEPIRQKWNGFSQHVAAVVCDNVDVVVLTLFSTLNNVSVYAVYYQVTNGIRQIIMTAAQGLEALFGNMLAKKETEKLNSVFEMAEWAIHFVVTVLFTIMAIVIVPFMRVYTKGITDADYIQPVFGVLMALAYGALCIRVPYFRMIKAAGHYKQTQNAAYISAGLNIAVSVFCVFRYGLIGVAIGTVAALMYHTCYFVWYLRSNIINRPIKYFIRYLLSDAILAIGAYIVAPEELFVSLTFSSWIFYALNIAFIVLLIALPINLLLHFRVMKQTFGAVFSKIKKTAGNT